MTDCVFCKIAAGSIPCAKLYETAHSLAFLDISPLNKGHALVIPKKHAKDIFEMSAEQMADVGKVARALAPVITEATGCEGLNLIQNNGQAAHQFVFHFHLHLIPRFSGDTFAFTWPAGKYGEGEMQAMQKRILEKLPKK